MSTPTARSTAPIDPGAPTPSATSTSVHTTQLLRAAWRMHRALVLSCAALGVVLMGLLALLRMRGQSVADQVLATVVECRAGGAGGPECLVAVNDALHIEFRVAAGLLALACTGLGALSGALAGAPVFAREFEQRTQVWGLTQSVGRSAWWAAKVVVVLLPVVLVMLAVGAVSSWSLNSFPWAEQPMATEVFLSRSYVPAAVAVLAMCLGLTAGIFWRSTIAAVLTAVLVTIGLVTGGEDLRPHMVTTDRYELPPGSYDETGAPLDAWFIGGGYLDATGRSVAWTSDCPEWNAIAPDAVITPEESQRITARCMARDGIVSQYTDVLPTSRFAALQAVWAGWALLISGLVLAAGFLRIRRRVL